ncbi:MAG: tripartite tricarboxylate transporter substrate-binding protein, partial [Bradyrhizobium guangdongense]
MGSTPAALRGCLLVLTVGLSLVTLPARAQQFPSRPITLVVPFAAGGPTDTLARILSERMAADLHGTVVVENVAGASGSIAGARVARAAPDGTTITIGHWGTHVLNGAIYKLPYDVIADFEPIALIASGPQLIVGKKGLKADSLKDLVAWLKDNPSKATAGTAGAGSGAHVAAVFFKNKTGTEFQLVPYRGAGPAMIDLVAGQIDLIFDQATNSIPHVKGGAIKAFAVTSPTRLASAPDIPTVDEAGVPGLYISYWHGIWAPKDTPKEIVDRLNAA